MTKRIFKYELLVNSKLPLTKVRMPFSAIVLSAGYQNGSIMIWAIVDAGEVVEAERSFYVMPTGYEELPEYKKFINTIFIPNGLVFHIFEA